MLVRDEPVASIIQEALEGFACGRLETQVEVKRFLENQPDYPKDTPKGEIRNQRIHDRLTQPLYAGYLEAPNWNISLRKAQHEGLITLETFEKIQHRLKEGAKAPARKDINEDFPLHGFVKCGDCEKPLTACWSKSKTGKKHPYYLCYNKACSSYRKSIPHAKIEGEFESILQSMQPAENLFILVKDMFKDAWQQRLSQSKHIAKTLQSDLAKSETQLEQLLDRIVEAENSTVIGAYESRIAKLEKDKLLITEKLANLDNPRHGFDELFELSLKFLSNPWKLWVSGQIALRKTVLRLAFAQQLAYRKNEGFRTPQVSVPFRFFDNILGKNEMVHPARFERATSAFGVDPIPF